MPKMDKVRLPTSHKSTRAREPRPPKESPDKYYCCRCGTEYKRQKDNFSASHSQLHVGNGGYFPICVTCVEDVLSHYKEVLGSEEEAVRRMCMKLDVYWNQALYATVPPSNNSKRSKFRRYLSKLNLGGNVERTFDDTLDEERDNAQTISIPISQAGNYDNGVILAPEDIPIPDIKIIKFWGYGFTPSEYAELEDKFADWTENIPKPLGKGAQNLYKNICLLDLSIAKDAAAGRSVEKSMNTLNTLIGSVNEKPVQKASNSVEDDFDALPFGVGIKMCENTRPISKPKPEYMDVDGIVRYITVWFLGHLCSMLGIRNTYCKLYEEEMARLRVERPDLAEEDDEGAFNDIFGTTGGDAS